MLQNISTSQDPYFHASSLLNVAEIDLSMGVPKDNVLKNIELVRSIFATLGIKLWIVSCDATLADGYLEKEDFPSAERLLDECLKSASEHHEIKSFCFERLAVSDGVQMNQSPAGQPYSLYILSSCR
jgi:hypothetical protein